MFNQVFDPDNLFWRIISGGVDFIGLSILWAALCLPVITAGPATAALYYTVVKVFRQHEDRTFRIMLTEFRNNLKKGIPLSIVSALILMAVMGGYRIMVMHTDTDFGAVMFMAYYVALIIPIGWVLYVFPVLGRFEQDIKGIAATAFALTIRHLPSTIILVLMNVQLAVFVLEKWVPVLFVPTLSALLSSFFLERIFIKYLKPEEQEAFRGEA
ncbi:MAG: YesL family protein [Eubacteriales bacterium]|nr:YesL family protein [Eubacteriales bacterium]